MLYFAIYNLLRIFLWWHENILARNEAESRQTLLINCLIVNQRKSSAQLIIEEPERVFLLDVGIEAGSIWSMHCVAARLIPELQLLNNQSEISILCVNHSEISILCVNQSEISILCVNQSEISILCVNQSEIRILCVNQSKMSIILFQPISD